MSDVIEWNIDQVDQFERMYPELYITEENLLVEQDCEE